MQNWTKAVELELHGVGSYRTVKSTEDAARCLLEHWQRGKNKAYMAAQQACLDALEGKTTPEFAREAFINAALAAKIHIRSTEDPRDRAMRGASGKDKPTSTDSAAFRIANRDAMRSIKKIVGKYRKDGPTD